jgi:hypothetical protein
MTLALRAWRWSLFMAFTFASVIGCEANASDVSRLDVRQGSASNSTWDGGTEFGGGGGVGGNIGGRAGADGTGGSFGNGGVGGTGGAAGGLSARGGGTSAQ